MATLNVVKVTLLLLPICWNQCLQKKKKKKKKKGWLATGPRKEAGTQISDHHPLARV
jgi:hypothetical protein